MYIVHGFWHNMYGIELFGIRGLSDDKVPKTFIVTEDIAKLILLLKVTINGSCVVKTKMVPVILHYLNLVITNHQCPLYHWLYHHCCLVVVYLFDVVCLSGRMSLTTRCSGGSRSSVLVTAAPSSTPQVGGCVV